MRCLVAPGSAMGYSRLYLNSPVGLRKLDLEGEPFRPRKIIYVSYFRNADFSFLVDISVQFEKKCETIAAYKLQFTGSVTTTHVFHPGIKVHDLMRVRVPQLGQLVGVQYAWAFTIREQMFVDDPQKLLVRSI